MMRILFVGEAWQGSSARSLREALALQPDVIISDIGEDQFLPKYHGLSLRIANRFLRILQQNELENAIRRTAGGVHPDVILIFKGAGIRASMLEEIQQSGTPVVNVFPDNSPHAFGHQLQEAIGRYDLVISTKPYHPLLWNTVYGYRNPCVFVPHGYDPKVHLWAEPASSPQIDLALCCTWRPEYQQLMLAIGNALRNDDVSVAIAGQGWSAHRNELPHHWRYLGPKTGRAYGEFLRSARIAIAPVTREAIVRGVKQPGDQDTTRTYELAAAQCFFLHQRTDYVATVYDEYNEVPMWSDAAELASLVRRWLPDEAGRRSMAAEAHARAVPAYSIPQRAVSVLGHIERVVNRNRALSKNV